MSTQVFIRLSNQNELPTLPEIGQVFPLLWWDPTSTAKAMFLPALATSSRVGNALTRGLLVAVGFEDLGADGPLQFFKAATPINEFPAGDYMNGLPTLQPGDFPPTAGDTFYVVAPGATLSAIGTPDLSGFYQKTAPLPSPNLIYDAANFEIFLFDGAKNLAPGFVLGLLPKKASIVVAGMPVNLPPEAKYVIGYAGDWGGTLYIDDATSFPVVGGTRLSLNGNRAAVFDGQDLRLEAPFDDDLKLVIGPAGPAGPAQLVLHKENLRCGFPGAASWIGVFADPTADSTVHVELRAPLSMAFSAPPLSNEKPLLLAAKATQTTTDAYPIDLNLSLGLGADWDFDASSLAKLVDTQPWWSFSDGVLELSSLDLLAQNGTTPWEIPELQSNLTSLLAAANMPADDGAMKFTITPAGDLVGLLGSSPARSFTVPMRLTVALGANRSDLRSLSLIFALPIEVTTGRFASNRVYGYFDGPLTAGAKTAQRPDAPARGALAAPDAQYLDLGVIALKLPRRGAPALPWTYTLPDETYHDFYLDFGTRELVIDLKYGPPMQAPAAPADEDDTPAPAPTNLLGIPPLVGDPLSIYIPGGFSALDGGELPAAEVEQRFILAARPFYPDKWPDDDPSGPGDSPLVLRLGPSGLTIAAKLVTRDVVVLPVDENAPTATKMQPLASRAGVDSELVVIDNHVRKGVIAAQMALPGVNNLVAQVGVKVRQDTPSSPPSVDVALNLETSDKSPIAALDAGFLRLQLDGITLGLKWQPADATNHTKGSWDLTALADGSLSLDDSVTDLGGLDDLRAEAAIEVHGLDLLKLRLTRLPGLALGLGSQGVSFSILDGLIAVNLADLKLAFGDGIASLSCRQASFSYRDSGSFDVTIEAGGLDVLFQRLTSVKMRLPQAIGVRVQVGDSATFSGTLAYRNDATERYFAASGHLQIDGLPDVGGFFKLGSGRKNSGQSVPNVVVYAAADIEIELFAGVVIKRLGAGVAVNNRLSGFPDEPDTETILRNINQIVPDQYSSWSFVKDDGTHIAIVGTVTMASDPGGNDVINAYVGSLVLSIDQQLRVMAAGKLWLGSSVGFVDQGDNQDHPALIGALAMVPRKRTLSVALQTAPNPAMESGGQLAAILSQSSARLTFKITPELVDYYLENLSYQADFFGASLRYAGSFRFAVFAGTSLTKADLGIQGDFGVKAGGGAWGLEAGGSLGIQLGYGGLLSAAGVAASAEFSATVNLSLKAFIEFSKTIGYKRWKKTLSVKITLPSTQLDLGLAGRAAFDEAGSVGLDAGLAVNVPFGGHALSVTAPVSMHTDVIDRVESRISVFEARLDAFDNPTPLARGIAGAGDARAIGVKERWLLYRSKNKAFFVVVPAAETPWLAPLYDQDALNPTTPPQTNPESPFLGHVTALRVTTKAGKTRDIAVPWNVAAWSPAKLEDPGLQDRVAALEMRFIQSATEYDRSAQTPATPITSRRAAVQYDVITDPRVESPSRPYWRVEDQFTLPDYALPFVFRSIDELAAAGGPVNPDTDTVDQDFVRVVTYEAFRARARRIARHHLDGIDDTDAIAQSRASIVSEMLADLRLTDSTAMQYGAAAFDADHAYVFSLDAGDDVDSVQIARAPAPGLHPPHPVWADVHLDAPDDDADSSPIADRIDRPVPRQQFFHSKSSQTGDAGSSTDGVTGTVLVKLPLCYDSALLQTGIEQLGHFAIYRKYPWEPKFSQIADFVHPDLSFVEPDNSPNAPTHALKPSIVVNPHLFTDSFQVTDGAFAVKGLVAAHSVLQYAFYLVPQGDTAPADPETAPDRFRIWPGVTLYVPAPTPLPGDLILAIPVAGLAAASTTAELERPFQLLELSGSALRLAQVGDRPLELADFGATLWAEEQPPAQSGFFAAGERDQVGEGGQAAPTGLDDMTADRLYEGQQGKFAVAVTQATDGAGLPIPGNFLLDATLLRRGFSYRFYLGSGAAAPVNAEIMPLLAPLATAVGREPPVGGVAASGVRPVEDLEWFASDGLQSAAARTFQGAPVFAPSTTFTVAPVEAADGTSLRIVWQTLSLFDGGVEILIQDRDEPNRIGRQVSEVLDESIFQNSQRDFSAAALWRVAPGQTLELAASLYRPQIYDISPQKKIVDYFVSTASPAAVISAVDSQLPPLHNALDDFPTQTGFSWIKLFNATAAWSDAVSNFARSTLNLNDAVIQGRIAALSASIRLMFAGCCTLPPLDLRALNDPAEPNPDPAAPPDTAQIAAAAMLANAASLLPGVLEQLKKRIADAVAAPLNDFDPNNPDASILAQDDARLARRLAAILRARLAVADDALSSDDLNVPVLPADTLAALPLEDAWKAAHAAAVAIAGTEAQIPVSLPQSSWFLSNFQEGPPNTNRGPIDPNQTAAKLVNALASGLVSELSGDNYRTKLAAVVPRAAGLTSVLDALHAEPDGSLASTEVETWVERPHHSAGSRVDKTTGERLPVPVDLASLLADSGRIPNQINASGDRDPASDDLSGGLRAVIAGTAGPLDLWTIVEERAPESAPVAGADLGLASLQAAAVVCINGLTLTLAAGTDQSGAGIARLWGYRPDGTPVTFRHGSRPVVAVAMGATDQGLLVVTSDADPSNPSVKVWDPDTPNAPLFTLADTGGVTSVGLENTPSGPVLLTVSVSGVSVWNSPTHSTPITVTPSVSIVAAFIWLETASAERTRQLYVAWAVVNSTAATKVNFTLADNSASGGWCETKAPVSSLAVAYGAGGPRLLVGGGDGNARLFNVEISGQDPVTVADNPNGAAVTAVALAPAHDDPGATTPGWGMAGLTASAAGTKLWRFGQDSPTPTPLGASAAPFAIALDAAPSVASLIARGALYYGNLLERMGFAVDLAAIDVLNQTVSQTDLVSALTTSIGGLTAKKSNARRSGRYALVQTAKPFDDHAVFLIAGRECDADFDGATPVGYAFVKLAVVPREFLDLLLREGPPADLARWYAIRAVTVGDDKTSDTSFRHIRELARFATPTLPFTSDQLSGAIIDVELTNTAARCVPAVAGCSHTLWWLPDRKGHRFRVALRRLPRYEPIQRWRDADFSPAPLPDAAAAGVWAEVSTVPLHDPALGEGPADLEVIPYAHPTRILLSYQLPAEGSRSISNAISAVRTGFRGSDLAFIYRVFDRPDAMAIDRFLQDQPAGPLKPTSGLTAPDPKLEPIPRNEGYHVNLFPGERLVTLTEQPFFYQYSIEATSSFRDRSTRPPGPNGDGQTWAGRLPSSLGYRRASITNGGTSGNILTVTVTIPLSLTGDHLSAEEREAAPPLLPAGPFPADQIPDPAMGYRLYYRSTPKPGQPPSLGAGYTKLVEVYMPWHDAYAAERPLFTTTRRIDPPVLYPVVLGFNGKCTVEAVVPVPATTTVNGCLVGIDYSASPYVFEISFNAKVDTSVFDVPDLSVFLLQAFRDGFYARTMRFH